MNKPNPPTARLTTGPVPQGLLRMTLPMILGISSSLLAGLAETYYISSLGSIPLAALGFTFPVTAALMSLTLGISIGMSSVLARAIGSGTDEPPHLIATGGLMLAGSLMIIVAIAGLLTLDPLLTLLGTNEETRPLASEYLAWWYASLFFMALPGIGANALRATGDAKVSSIIMIAGSVLQILLAPLFVFGWLGLPELGMPGAAVGNFCARVVICLVTVYVLTHRHQLIQRGGATLNEILSIWQRILAVGLPAMATNMIGPLSGGVITALLAQYGQETVAGFGIASRLEGLVVIPLFALSASIGPFVGQNWGAKAFDRADEAMRLTFKWSLAWGAFVALLLYLARYPLIHQFDSNPEVSEVAASYLIILPISYGAWGIIMMTSAIFNSLGHPLRSTALSIARMLVIYLPLAFALSAWLGAMGIFAAAAAANVIVATLGFVWNRKTFSIKPDAATQPA